MKSGLHTAREAPVPAAVFVTMAVAGALLSYAVLVYTAMMRAGGVFEYPLDDVYIHLAMAGQIAHGGYGVNAGEFASAASSPLYPLLLVPFADGPYQWWLPAVWNVLALVFAAWLMGLALAEARLGWIGLMLAAAAPVALNMYSVAFTGMENMTHGAASLAIVLGLWRFVESYRIGWLLILGVVFAPAFRLEGLALALAAGGVVLVLGRPVAGLGLMLLGLFPVAAFAGFLTWIGLDPLPNSVVAKLAEGGASGAEPLVGAIVKLIRNAQTYGGRYLLVLIAAVLLVSLAVFRTDSRRGWFGLAVAAAAFAHLAFGAIGWMDRYENYALLSLAAALALLLSGSALVVRQGAVALALAGGLLTYLPYFPNNAENLSAIHLQQAQLSRFAKDFAKVPVAVNDIGHVGWRNPNYVLDLWGLASKTALSLRLANPAPGWAEPLAESHGVRLAMIYDHWVGEAVGPGWVRLGTLWIDAPGAFLGGPEVAFYATDPADADDLRAQLVEWQKDLPERSWFEFAEGQPG